MINLPDPDNNRSCLFIALIVPNRERGTMALAWNVLETGDGAAIGIIYTGDAG